MRLLPLVLRHEVVYACTPEASGVLLLVFSGKNEMRLPQSEQ
jgi:hypothetical protein